MSRNPLFQFFKGLPSTNRSNESDKSVSIITPSNPNDTIMNQLINVGLKSQIISRNDGIINSSKHDSTIRSSHKFKNDSGRIQFEPQMKFNHQPLDQNQIQSFKKTIVEKYNHDYLKSNPNKQLDISFIDSTFTSRDKWRGYLIDYLLNIQPTSSQFILSKLKELYLSSDFVVNDSNPNRKSMIGLMSSKSNVVIGYDIESHLFLNDPISKDESFSLFNQEVNELLNDIVDFILSRQQSTTSIDEKQFESELESLTTRFMRVFIDDKNRKLKLSSSLLPSSIVNRYSLEDVYDNLPMLESNSTIAIDDPGIWSRELKNDDIKFKFMTDIVSTNIPNERLTLTNYPFINTSVDSNGYIRMINPDQIPNMFSKQSIENSNREIFSKSNSSLVKNQLGLTNPYLNGRDQSIRNRLSQIELSNPVNESKLITTDKMISFSPTEQQPEVINIPTFELNTGNHCALPEYDGSGAKWISWNWDLNPQTNHQDCNQSIHKTVSTQFIKYTNVKGQIRYVTPFKLKSLITKYGGDDNEKLLITSEPWNDKGKTDDTVDDWSDYFTLTSRVKESDINLSIDDVKNSNYHPRVRVRLNDGPSIKSSRFETLTNPIAIKNGTGKKYLDKGYFYYTDFDLAECITKFESINGYIPELELMLMNKQSYQLTSGRGYKRIGNGIGQLDSSTFNFESSDSIAKIQPCACNFLTLSKNVIMIDDRFRFKLYNYLSSRMNCRMLLDELLREMIEQLTNDLNLVLMYRLNQSYMTFIHKYVLTSGYNQYFNIECPYLPMMIFSQSDVILPKRCYVSDSIGIDVDVDESRVDSVESRVESNESIDERVESTQHLTNRFYTFKHPSSSLYYNLLKSFSIRISSENIPMIPVIEIKNVSNPHDLIDDSLKEPIVTSSSVPVDNMTETRNDFIGYRIALDILNDYFQSRFTNDPELAKGLSKSGMFSQFKLNNVRSIRVSNLNHKVRIEYKLSNCCMVVVKNGFIDNSALVNEQSEIEDTNDLNRSMTISKRWLKYGNAVSIPGSLINRYKTGFN